MESFSQYYENDAEKIYCANCIHCKIVKERDGNGSQYYLRVRWEEGKGKKKLGGEKLYKYFTVARRSIEKCESYIPMGELKEFLKDLKKNLPIKDELYQQ